MEKNMKKWYVSYPCRGCYWGKLDEAFVTITILLPNAFTKIDAIEEAKDWMQKIEKEGEDNPQEDIYIFYK